MSKIRQCFLIDISNNIVLEYYPDNDKWILITIFFDKDKYKQISHKRAWNLIKNYDMALWDELEKMVGRPIDKENKDD